MTKLNTICLFLFLIFIGATIPSTVFAQCTEVYNWVKQGDICGDTNNGTATVIFQNINVPCDPGNGNLDLHVYFFVNPDPRRAPAIFDPLRGLPYETMTPLPNPNLTFLGSIDAPSICDVNYSFSHSFVDSMTCSGYEVSFFLIPWDRDLDSDNDGVFGEYNQTGLTCPWSREEITVLGAPCNPLIDIVTISERVTCTGGPGSATTVVSGGVAPYTYFWNTGETTSSISGLPVGWYYLTVTDNVGCTKSKAGFIQAQAPDILATVTSTDISCNGELDGTATVTGSAPATFCKVTGYIWETGDTTTTITGLSPGIYNVTVNSDDCCPSVHQVVINQPSVLISLVGNVINNSCSGNSDGSAVATGLGGTAPYQFIWSNGTTNQIITGLASGTYDLTMTDAMGCTETNTITISDETVLEAIIAVGEVSCFGYGDGELTLTAPGAVDPLRVIWSDGQTGVTASGLMPGTYSATVFDAIGCSDEVTGTVLNTEKLKAAVSIINEACDGTTGSATVIPSSSNAPYMINWSDGQTTETATDLIAGQYDVTILDARGCCLDLSVNVGLETCNLCVEAILGNLDICDTITVEPNQPLSTIDCDGDGVTNQDECTDGTDPLDPCDFDDTSITGPVVADQTGCLNLCPDLTPIITILPGNIAGATVVEVAVEITELNDYDTDGSGILVRVPSDPRLGFTWDPVLTMAALTPVQNPDWKYLGNNGIVHTWSYQQAGLIIGAGNTSAFGLRAVYDPQSTDGQTTVTASIVPFSGGECNILNDTDSERLVYFE